MAFLEVIATSAGAPPRRFKGTEIRSRDRSWIGIDLHLEVNPLSQQELMNKANGESSESIRERVEKARALQYQRFGESRTNASLNAKELQELCELDSGSRSLLEQAIFSLDLSARAYDRILRVSRTIADLEASETIQAQHIAEAIQYRTLDRKLW